jgi:hypothetical protein
MRRAPSVKPLRPRRPASARHPPARGLILPVLLLLMALMAGLVLNVWRSAIARESLAGADADRLQARQAARALIREAQQDILATAPEERHAPGPEGSTQAFFPRDMVAWPRLVERLQRPDGLPCQHGICLALPSADSLSSWASRLSGAASPGQFVSRAAGSDLAFAQLYPGTAAYWVEVLPFDNDSKSASSHIDATPGPTPLVYRITSYALGRLPGTQVVQQVLWLSGTDAPDRVNAPRVLQWREWLP